MPDEQNTNQQQQAETTQQQTTSGTGGGEAGKYQPATVDDAVKIIQALEKRLSERDASINNLTGRISSIEEERRKRLEQEGNWSELARQRQAELDALKPYQERAQALEAVIRESNEQRLKGIPDDMRGLVPTDYAPEKLQAWLNANERRLLKPAAPNYDAGAGAGGTGKAGSDVQVTDDDRRAASLASANGFKVTPEQIAKRRLGKT